MDLSSYKTWERIALVAIAIGAIIYFNFSKEEGVNSYSSSNSDSNNLCGTYVEYPNVDKRITRTYVLNNDGSATVTFKSVNDFSNRTETITEYGYWDKINGYIEVVYDDDHHAFLDLSERKVYHGYTYYRSRQGGCEFKKTY